MFLSARLKLTAWYLLIIMMISILFSIAFYKASTREIQRIIHRIEIGNQLQLNSPIMMYLRQLNQPLENSLKETEQHLRLLLLLINLSILISAGGIGYFLAGQTLRPIQEMLDGQHRFITDSSHELRTPITALRAEMEAGLLDKKISAQEARQLIASNLEEVIRLQNLSDNLLQLTQYQQQKTGFHIDTLSLSQITEDALKKILPLAKKKGINIENSVSDMTFSGESIGLTQLLVILLDNAIKYSPESTKISLYSQKTEHDVKISIADQGIGIDKKDILHIFDRFYRADASRTKTESAGYGLGLSIAKKIVDRHRGKIYVESKAGQGSTFTIQLPTSHS